MIGLPLLLASVLVAGTGAAPKKGYMPLAEQVDRATLICIGAVEEVIEVELPEANWMAHTGRPRTAVQVGRIAIEQVIKGPADLEVAHHEVWRSWTCDTTQARVGERSLFLLTSPGTLAEAPAAARQAVERAVGPENILRNVGSGDGIVPIRGAPGQEIVSCAGTPEALVISGYHDAPLADVLSYMSELVRFDSSVVDVHLYGWPSFDARILADGACRLAVTLGGGEQVRFFQLDEPRWRALQSRLAYFVGHRHRVVDDLPASALFARRLHVRTPDGSLRMVLSSRSDTTKLPASDQASLHDALWAWDAVFQELNCAECYDYTLADRELLQGR